MGDDCPERVDAGLAETVGRRQIERGSAVMSARGRDQHEMERCMTGTSLPGASPRE